MKLKDVDVIVFVCTGNIMRSAFAEVYARHIGIQLPVLSGGTGHTHETMHNRTVEALRRFHVDEKAIQSFHPTQIQDLDLKHYKEPLFLAMKFEHREEIKKQLGNQYRIHLLGELCSNGVEIQDPYFTHHYEAIYNLIAKNVDALKQQLDER